MLLAYGFSQAHCDHSLFILSKANSFIVILVYVDDILAAVNDVSAINAVKNHLASHFKIKDLGALRYFLGIEVARSSKGIYLNQHKYSLDIVTDMGYMNAKPALIPMKKNHTLLSNTTSPLLTNVSSYRRLVG